MAFNFTDSWNPANDSKQAPWGSYTQRFAGDKYGDLSKFNLGNEVTVGQGGGTQSNNGLTLAYSSPTQVFSGGPSPLSSILGAVASIGMGALSGGFGGGGGGGGLGANFSSAGAAPTGISWGDAIKYTPSF
jgi:hypothetical protein